jgi:hypothetical protein
VSKRRSAVTTSRTTDESRISVVRTALAALLVLAGIGWMTYYLVAVQDDAKPKWIFDLADWNFAIGFGAIFLGLIVASHPRTPLGRGQGVVVGMLGCFLFGLAWIVVYYVTSQNANIPVIRDLGNYNLLVGIGFMATGFVYATKWE